MNKEQLRKFNFFLRCFLQQNRPLCVYKANRHKNVNSKKKV